MLVLAGTGILTHEPELQPVGETVVCKFTLVTNEYRKVGGDSVKYSHYLNFEAWDSGARTIVERAHKGDTLVVKAKPRQVTWEDRSTGQKYNRVMFRLEEFQIINTAKEDVA